MNTDPDDRPRLAQAYSYLSTELTAMLATRTLTTPGPVEVDVAHGRDISDEAYSSVIIQTEAAVPGSRWGLRHRTLADASMGDDDTAIPDARRLALFYDAGPVLASALRQVLYHHTPSTRPGAADQCAGCEVPGISFTYWPCPTVATTVAALSDLLPPTLRDQPTLGADPHHAGRAYLESLRDYGDTSATLAHAVDATLSALDQP